MAAITAKDIKDKVDGREMDLSLMQISKVPVKEIATFKKVNSIDLSCNQITMLPEIFCSVLNYIVKLDLSKNRVHEIPKDIYKLENLQHLDLYKNNIEDLPISFSRLKSLKWLDLKDNPLNPVLVKVVGGCLDDKECKKCAVAVVTYYKNVSSDMERIRQQELKKEREKKAMIRKVEEELEREKEQERKRKKQLEKEERRRKWEQEKESRKRKRDDDSSEDDDVKPMESKDVVNNQSWFFTFWGVLIMCFVAVILSAIGVRLYCQENPSNAQCVLVKEWTQNYRQATGEHIGALVDNGGQAAQYVVKKILELKRNLGY